MLRIPSPIADGPLVQQLDDDDRFVRYSAMLALSHRPTSEYFGLSSKITSPRVLIRLLVAAHLRIELPPAKEATAVIERLLNSANLNSENQIVISGTKDGVEEAITACKSSGAKRAIPLAMSVPSHSLLMLDAAKKFSEFLDSIELKKPKNEVLHNLDALPETKIDVIKDKLVKQIYNPVRWFDIIKSISNKRTKVIIECGPSKVLSGLIKRISPKLETKDLDNYENYLSIIKQ